jgi:octaprenyl-diphosphate synthase
MDYTSPKMGKDKGDDFMEGKITLPVIIALKNANDKDKKYIENNILNPSIDNLNEFISVIDRYDGFKQSIAIAKDYSNKASDALLGHSGDIAGQLIDLPRSILMRAS